MVDHPYHSANTNFRSAPDMSWTDLCLAWSFWTLHLIIIFVFTQTDVPVAVVNSLWMFAWTYGIVRAVYLISKAQDVDDARSHGLNSPQYIRVMTSRPMPTITVSVVSDGIMFCVAISCFIAGSQFLGGVFLFSAFLNMGLFKDRWVYHSRIGY